jgi:hypothetical protein
MKIIQIENPCKEKWENMHDFSGGKFCDLCSKIVLDLTQKSDDEILKILENSDGKICGRISKHKTNKEIIHFEDENFNYEKTKGYSGLVAGLTIVAALTGLNANAKTTNSLPVQIVQNKNITEKKLEQEKISDNDFIISGKLINSEIRKPLESIEVTFITKNKIFKAKTNKQGYYKIVVPDYLIKKTKNILHFDFGGYNDKDYILTKEELKNKEFQFSSDEIDEMVILAGGISSRKLEPTILLDGEEIDEKEFYTLKMEDYKIFRFYGEIAKALHSETSRDGLYLVYSK